MNIDEQAASRKIVQSIVASKTGRLLFSTQRKSEEFIRGWDHVSRLLKDAYSLYIAGSFATSVFISITAIEEVAKLEITCFRNSERTEPAKKRHDDLLFNHRAKHAIALQEVICIGTRLPKAIGEERVRFLLDMAESGKLVELRESALYTDNIEGNFVCPADVISKETSRELLLLALEVWDDRLVGITNYTYEVDAELVRIFELVASETKESPPPVLENSSKP